MGGRGSASSRAGGGGYSSADKAMQVASGGVVLRDKYTEIEVEARKRNKRASTEYSKEVLSAKVDENGNVSLDYAKGSYSGNYGDEYQKVTYNIKSGLVDGKPVNMNLKKAQSITGKTYPAREAAKAAGMTWNGDANAYISKNHPLNTKTNYSAKELSSMSDKKLRNVYEAAYTKYAVKNHKSLGEISDTLKKNKNKSASRESMIKAITSL